MMDIVERLRGHEELGTNLEDAAADEIERLRAALEHIDNYMEHRYQSDPMKRARNIIQGIAREALKQSENDN